uniref:MARVEL domain-containing protein n=1 Tax=Panagrolaimus sp. JU765 TaxID=591449 RepID=A0AC34Q407_9BILA
MVEIDKEFPKAFPFGVLKTIQWAAPLCFMITIYAGTYIFGGIGFSLFVAWNAFIYSLITWFLYLFGIHKRGFELSGGRFVYIPLALMDFFLSLIFFVAFGIATIICVVCVFESFRYRFGVLVTYLFATGFSMVSGAAFAYFALLLYRACPNGQLRNLFTLVVEGTTISQKADVGPPGTTTTMTA